MFNKMIFLSGFIEVIMMIIVCFALYTFHLNDRKQRIIKMESILYECGNLRLEMLIRRDSNFVELYDTNHKKIIENLAIYDSLVSTLSLTNQIEILNKVKREYQKEIMEYAVLLNQFGLTENIGIEGKFRDNIHKIEEFLKTVNNDKIYLYMLQSRRREKDYIMRGRLEYVSQVYEFIQKLKYEVVQSNLPESKKIELDSLADVYSSSFEEFVLISNKISTKEKSMLLLESSLKKTINDLVAVETNIAEGYQSTLIPLFIFSIVISFIMSIFIARSITKPLIKLKYATIKIAKGELKIQVKIESEDEIGDLARFFNNMIEKIAEANEIIMKQQSKLNNQFIELKEINATRDKFFSIIAHDLKNPISSFMGVAAFLTKTFQDLSREEIKEFLDEVNTSAKSLYELLENLLLWSRTQRGLINFHPHKIDVKSLVINNIDLLKFSADNKKIRLVYSINNHSEIYADPNILNTILRNLITNAIKFTNDYGEVKVVCEETNSHCHFSVIDNGVGIPQEKIDKLFKLDGSVSTAGTNQESGTGLGLILCKEFVDKHNGTIWVESQIDRGSQFHFSIPSTQ